MLHSVSSQHKNPKARHYPKSSWAEPSTKKQYLSRPGQRSIDSCQAESVRALLKEVWTVRSAAQGAGPDKCTQLQPLIQTARRKAEDMPILLLCRSAQEEVKCSASLYIHSLPNHYFPSVPEKNDTTSDKRRSHRSFIVKMLKALCTLKNTESRVGRGY